MKLSAVGEGRSEISAFSVHSTSLNYSPDLRNETTLCVLSYGASLVKTSHILVNNNTN
jgi:hypothetical protein